MARTRPDACANLKRSSHRGWLLIAAPVEQVVTIYPGPFALTRLEARGVPLKFYWPVMSDFEGAKMLIDAVMDADLPALLRLNARFPEFDFQLGEWFECLKRDAEKASRTLRKTLKVQHLPHGLRMDVELETDTDTGLRAIVQIIYRGNKPVARKVLTQDVPAMTAKGNKKEPAKPLELAKPPAIVRPPKPKKQPDPEPEVLAVHSSLAKA